MTNKKKERTIAGFGSVADSNLKGNSNIDSDKDTNNDFLKEIVESNKPKEKTHIFKGYYLEIEIANKIDEMAEGKPKGTKSDIVNESLKKVFKDMGWL